MPYQPQILNWLRSGQEIALAAMSGNKRPALQYKFESGASLDHMPALYLHIGEMQNDGTLFSRGCRRVPLPDGFVNPPVGEMESWEPVTILEAEAGSFGDDLGQYFTLMVDNKVIRKGVPMPEEYVL